MKVWPKNDQFRKLLVHPSGGGFRETGPADWPDDTFTYRLIRDGDLTTNAPPAAASERRKPTEAAKPAVKGD